MRFVLLVLSVVLTGGIFYIFGYNSLVGLRHEAKTLKQDIVAMQTKNAELKNELYEIIDPVALQKLAPEFGLVLEERPMYIGYTR